MAFKVVHDYYRREIFDFFRPYPSPFWAVTFEVDITRLREFLRRYKYPTYLNLCYFFTRAMQELEDFRYRLHGEQIVLYDVLHPGLTVPAPGRRFSFSYHDYHPDSAAFNRAAAARESRDEAIRLKEEGGRAWVFFSALPAVAFTGLTHAVRDAADGEPRVSFGRFQERRGRVRVPVGLQVNHLFIDGGTVGELVERVEAVFDDPD